jgi:hypothetical protein
MTQEEVSGKITKVSPPTDKGDPQHHSTKSLIQFFSKLKDSISSGKSQSSSKHIFTSSESSVAGGPKSQQMSLTGQHYSKRLSEDHSQYKSRDYILANL